MSISGVHRIRSYTCLPSPLTFTTFVSVTLSLLTHKQNAGLCYIKHLTIISPFNLKTTIFLNIILQTGWLYKPDCKTNLFSCHLNHCRIFVELASYEDTHNCQTDPSCARLMNNIKLDFLYLAS